MDDKGKNLKTDIDSEKLVWEIPMLINLDKSNTEGGTSPATPEDSSGTQS